MAEEKEPERKKLSLHGNKKLSLGSGQDFIKSNRNNNIPGTRSVQVETRRKRIVRGGLKQNLNFEGNKLKLNQINSQTNLTEREREARMNALKHGLQGIESKTNNEKFLSKDEINKIQNRYFRSKLYKWKKANSDKTKISNNLKESSDVLQTKNENYVNEKTKKQSEAKFNKDEIDVDKRKQKIKITVRRDEPRRRAGKITITDALSGQEGRMRSLSAMRRQREKVKTQTESVPQVKQYRDVIIPDSITVGELAIRMSEKTADVVKQLMNLDIMATATQIIDGETAELVVTELGHRPKRVSDLI